MEDEKLHRGSTTEQSEGEQLKAGPEGVRPHGPNNPPSPANIEPALCGFFGVCIRILEMEDEKLHLSQ
jgi:hypothetical protein